VSDPPSEDIVRAARALSEARSVLFITGAGVSADSGLPTYRGIGGLYEDAETDEGVAIEEALSGPMFAADPAVTWKYIRQIEAACRGASFNDAHRLMASLERSKPRVWVLTQNVDGFHRAAGSENVVEIHGDVHDLHCTECAWAERVGDYASLDPFPHCPRCGAVIRPRVVLFGEMLPAPAVASYERELRRGFDVVVAAGTTASFPYIAAPVMQARAMGKTTIEINPGHTVLSGVVDTRLRMGAAAAMRALTGAMRAG
jgi:NAD-dependent deacetylase